MAPNIGQKSVFEEQRNGKALTFDLLALKCILSRHFVDVVLTGCIDVWPAKSNQLFSVCKRTFKQILAGLKD